MSTLTFKDIGPIDEFSCEIQPGLNVLLGDHGVGKTTILRTVQLGIDGRTDIKPQKRDGARTGVATVAGKTLKITKQIREEGELSVERLGDLDIATLHDPQFVDAKTRDKHRIRTLVRLAGVKADASLFHDLLGGEANFLATVDADSLKTDDLVEMSARVKRAIEKAAQASESKAESAKANARAKSDQADGVDLAAPHDEEELQSALQEAFEVRTSLMQRRKDALEIIGRATEAKSRLAESEEDAVSVADAGNAVAKATEIRCDAESIVLDLRNRLAAAESALKVAESNERHAAEARDAAERHAKTLAKWKDEISAAESVECPSDEMVAVAAAAVTKANEAIAVGIKVRAAIRANSDAAAFHEEAVAHAKAAKNLRIAAQQTQDVLSDAIARISECPLRVSINDDGDARLVIGTDRSEQEPFDDLSDGERWPPILRLAAAKNRLIVLPQRAFGELNDPSRAKLDTLAQDIGCCVLTAQVDTGELRCIRYAEMTVSV